jgi:hypothetical protein
VEAPLGPRAFNRYVEALKGMTLEEKRAEFQSIAKEIGWEYEITWD